MVKYIGIDISKATLDCYDGKNSFQVSNDTHGFQEIIGRSEKDRELCLIFEPTGIYAHALIDYCQKHRIKAFIVGSKEARDYARSIKQRSKTDRIDAKVLYRYQSQLDASRLSVPSLDHRMWQITRRRNAYEKYSQIIQTLRNLIEATDEEDKELIRSLNRQIRSLQKAADLLLDEIEELLSQSSENRQALNHLQTIPGIGRQSALALLLEFLRYPHARSSEMVALMGLDPVLRESGVFRGKSRISKQGGTHLRKKLFMATVVATRYNDRIKVFYERLISKGKPKMSALLASMRKLLRIAFAVFKNQTPYQAIERQ